MPAPTALQKAPETPLPEPVDQTLEGMFVDLCVVVFTSSEQGLTCCVDAAEEGALDLQSSPAFIAPEPQPSGEDEAMNVDEELRPQFAPAQDVVCAHSRSIGLTEVTETNSGS